MVAERQRDFDAIYFTAQRFETAHRAEVAKMNEEFALASRRKLELESLIKSLELDRDNLSTGLGASQQQVREATKELEAKERRSAQVDARIQFLEGGITPLLQRQGELQGDIRELEHQRETAEAKIAALDSDYLSKKDKIEAEIGNLLAKQQELEVAQAGMLRQYNQMSEDIATRTKVADEREDILKRREFKVAQDEKMVARNAGLINL